MGQPHKHAALIKLWADGAEIQVYISQDAPPYWRDISTPTWGINCEYRIKPKTIRYRNYMWQTGLGERSISILTSDNHAFNQTDVENHSNFIKWLGDWQVVEV